MWIDLSDKWHFEEKDQHIQLQNAVDFFSGFLSGKNDFDIIYAYGFKTFGRMHNS